MGGSIVLDFQFRHHLHDHEILDLVRKLSLLETLYISEGRRERRIWKLDVNGPFG